MRHLSAHSPAAALVRVRVPRGGAVSREERAINRHNVSVRAASRFDSACAVLLSSSFSNESNSRGLLLLVLAYAAAATVMTSAYRNRASDHSSTCGQPYTPAGILDVGLHIHMLAGSTLGGGGATTAKHQHIQLSHELKLSVER